MIAVTDEALFERWVKGRDAEAFREIASRHAGVVHATCRRILQDATEAEDVAQECFETLAKTSRSTGPYLGAWLHRVATNLSLNRVKSGKRRKLRERRYAETHAKCAKAEWDDVYAHVDKAIAELPDKLRVPIVAHFIENQSHKDIAGVLGVSRPTVTYRIGKGLERVRETLKKQGIAASGASLAAMFVAHMAEAAPLSASIEAALGKLAVAGVGGQAATFTGLVAMKELVAGAAILAVFIFGALAYIKEDPEPKGASYEPLPVVSIDESQAVGQASGQDSPGDEEGINEASVPLDEQPLARSVLSGYVWDLETGEGLAGAAVQAGERASLTDVSGYYQIEGLPVGRLEVSVLNAPGYSAPERGIQVLLRPGEELSAVNFRLYKGLSIKGIVVDASGRMLSDATIQIHCPGDERVEYAQSGPDGTFQAFGFKPFSSLHLSARKGELVSPEWHIIELEETDVDDMRLSIQSGSSIAGTVVDERGRPLSAWDVKAMSGAFTGVVNHKLAPSDKSDTRGAFRITGIPAGSYSLKLYKAGTGGNSFGSAAQVELALDQHITGLRLTADSAMAISGRVLDRTGSPIPGVTVYFGIRTTTDIHGEYSLLILDEGSYSLNAAKKGFITAERGAYTGTSGVDFTLDPSGAIEGRVTAALTGLPVTEFQVATAFKAPSRFSPGYRYDHIQVNNSQGQFRFDDVSPRVAGVLVRAPGFAGEVYAPIRPPRPGETTHLQDLILQPAATIQGRVTDQNGSPIAGVRIFQDSVPSQRFFKQATIAITDTNGAFTIDTLSPQQTTTLAAQHPRFTPGGTQVLPGASRPDEVNIVLVKGGRIEGSVLIGGKPAADFKITAWARNTWDTRRPTTSTKTDGSFVLSNISPGDVGVEVKSDGGESRTRMVTVRSEETTSLTFEFKPGRAHDPPVSTY